MIWLQRDFQWLAEGSFQGSDPSSGAGFSVERYRIAGVRSDGRHFHVQGSINFSLTGEPGQQQAEDQIKSNFDEYLDPIRFPDGH